MKKSTHIIAILAGTILTANAILNVVKNIISLIQTYQVVTQLSYYFIYAVAISFIMGVAWLAFGLLTVSSAVNRMTNKFAKPTKPLAIVAIVAFSLNFCNFVGTLASYIVRGISEYLVQYLSQPKYLIGTFLSLMSPIIIIICCAHMLSKNSRSTKVLQIIAVVIPATQIFLIIYNKILSAMQSSGLSFQRSFMYGLGTFLISIVFNIALAYAQIYLLRTKKNTAEQILE